MASSLRQLQECDLRYFSGKVKVVILASEWGSINGGLSTISRELAIHLAKFRDAEVTLFLPKCSLENKEEALSQFGISIVEEKRWPGYEELDWLMLPPEHMQIDVIVGHGVNLGRQAQIIRSVRRCKWVQVIHTDPEEEGMFKSYKNSVSKGEKERHVEVELCQMADLVVGVGPKLTEAFRKYLSWCKKDVFELTPGVFAEFENVEHATVERRQCTVLVFGHGGAGDFLLKGFDIAAKSVAALHDTILLFVGAPEEKNDEIAKRFLDSGIPSKRLKVRGFMDSREAVKRLFCEVDLVLMPSRTEGFGLSGLVALSAGLPVIVSKNSGFGEALLSVPSGHSFVIDSEDPNVWTEAIKGIWNRDKQMQLEEVRNLRDSYGERYSWSVQCKDLFKKMVNLLENREDASRKPHISVEEHVERKTRSSSEDRAETSTATDQAAAAINLGEQGPSAILETEDQRSWRQHGESYVELIIKAENLTKEQEDSMKEIFTKVVENYVKYKAFPSDNVAQALRSFTDYLSTLNKAFLVSLGKGSVIIILDCPTLESLELLWIDYRSGYLDKVAERYLVTDEIKKTLSLETLRLKTTIKKENYMNCRKALMKVPRTSSEKRRPVQESMSPCLKAEPAPEPVREIGIHGKKKEERPPEPSVTPSPEKPAREIDICRESR